MSDAGYIPWQFDKSRAVLLVIDMQNDFVAKGGILECPMARHYLPNMQKIVAACRASQIPVIYTVHQLYDEFDVSPLEVAYHTSYAALKDKGMRYGTPGYLIVSELSPLPAEIVIRKHRYDAFYNTRLETVIRNIRGLYVADTVIIVGTVTNVCCESTARSAFMRDFKVLFVSDGNGGLDEASHNATLSTIRRAFGRVMNTEELIRKIEA